MIQNTRIEQLNEKRVLSGDYVLYWMQASQRTECNHALAFAIRQANELKQPVVVYFGLTDSYPEANERHYFFMLQGIQEVQKSLKDMGIQMVIGHEPPEIGAVNISKRASLAVCDRGYTSFQRQWRRNMADKANCTVFLVESDVVVPIREVSNKEEYSAATLRRKIEKKLPEYLVYLEQSIPFKSSLGMGLESYDISDIDKVISNLAIDHSITRVEKYRGGTSEAKKHLKYFIENKLDNYPELRNDPNADSLSKMSPYLHFGQISPLQIALEVLKSDSPGKDAYLEELITRRELSMNYVFYNREYNSFDGIPEWSKKILREHKADRRPYEYSAEQLENGLTHDPYWNAAQNEMVSTGKMHGYMRMYWGKKILEWTAEPEEAYRTALYLNNKYELDGRDPNGYAGIAWCFGKHDRPWASRQIFGNVRFMNSNGLRRKFDVDRYAQKYQPGKSLNSG